MINVKEIASYKDYGRVVSISNGIIEAYVTVDIGPRIIRFGFVGGQNIMCANRADFAPKTDADYENFFGKGKAWNSFGGHRIWLSPESYPETYYPDCDPVAYEITENGAVFTPPAIAALGVQIGLEIKMGDTADMQVIMTAKNITAEDKKFSIWALSVSEKGGTVIVPMNTNDTGLLANRVVAVWPYTDMSDERIFWGKKYVTVAQDKSAEAPIKLGFDLNDGKVYYVIGDDVFCKRYDAKHLDGAEYPDGGCSFETYTNSVMIEVETLGEYKTVASGETSVHTEYWSLAKKPCDVDFKDNASLDNFVSKL